SDLADLLVHLECRKFGLLLLGRGNAEAQPLHFERRVAGGFAGDEPFEPRAMARYADADIEVLAVVIERPLLLDQLVLLAGKRGERPAQRSDRSPTALH